MFPKNSVSISDAKKRLGALVDQVGRQGEVVVITRLGQPVARLVPYEIGVSWTLARHAAEALRVASRGKTLGGMSIRSLVEEERR